MPVFLLPVRLVVSSSNPLITRESCKELQLKVGQQVWGQIKSTALLD